MNRGVQGLLPLLALAVGFLAGAGFGVVVLSDAGVEPAAESDASLRTRKDAPTPDSPRDVARNAGVEPRSGSRRRGVSSESVMLENAMRGTVDVPTGGSGVITGAVLDELGKPVAGVVVRARTSLGSVRKGSKPGEDDKGEVEEMEIGVGAKASDPATATLEDRIRSVVQAFRFEEATSRTATSGADGMYRLEGLIDAEYTLAPKKAGFSFRTAAGANLKAAPGDIRDFIASPVVAVVLVPRLPDGTTATKAHLSYLAFATNATTSKLWSLRDGPLELPPGDYEFTVTAGDGNRYRSAATRIEVVAGAETTAEIALETRPGVAGTVHFGGEQPSTVGVAALRLDDGGDPDPARLISSPSIHWPEAPFEFAVLDLPPGSYLLGAVLRNGRVLESRMVEVGDGLLEEDFTIGDVDVRDYTVVRVRGPDGQPVRDATFSVGFTADNVSFEGQLTVARQADGSYHVPHTVPGSPRTGYNGWSSSGNVAALSSPDGTTFFLRLTSARFGQKRVEFDPLAQRELDVAFGEPAFALVTVAGYANSQWRGRVQISIAPAADANGSGGSSQGPVQQKSMTPQGVARVGPAEPGRYWAVLMIITQENGTREVMRQEVSLGIGETSLTMSIPPLHGLVMECQGNALDLDLHRDPGVGQVTDFLDEGVRDGMLTRFTALPVGRYRVRAYGDGSVGEMLVDVPAGGTIVFRPTAYNSLRVDTVPKAAEGVLRQGDLIVRIGDTALEGGVGFQSVLGLARMQETAQLTIRRGGGEMEVTVPTEGLDYGPLVNWMR